MADPNRIRRATDAALEIARSGQAASDAVDNIRARFDLTDAERTDVVAGVCRVLDAHDRDRALAAQPILEAARGSLDVLAKIVVSMRRLAAEGPVPGSSLALLTLRETALLLAVAIIASLEAAQPLLVGADIDRAARMTANAEGLQLQAKGIGVVIVTAEIEIRRGRFVRATANVTPCDGVDGELAVDGYPLVVCAEWGTPIELPPGHRIHVEGELVEAARRQIESLA